MHVELLIAPSTVYHNQFCVFLPMQVTVLLRTISFVKDPNFLTVYLREILLDR